MAALAVFCVSFLILCAPAWLKADQGRAAGEVSLAILAISGLLFIVVHIIRSRAYEEMLSRVLLALALVVGCAIPVVQFICIPALLLFTLINIAEALKSLVDLRLHIAISLVLAGLLILIEKAGDPASIGYAVVAAGFAWRICRRPLYFALLELSVMVVSVPLSAMIIISIVSGLRTLFSVTTSAVTSNIRVTQNVAAHMRGSVAVQGYQREVSQAVQQLASTVSANPGAAAGIGAAATLPGAAGAEQVAGLPSRRWLLVLLVVAGVMAALVWLGGSGTSPEVVETAAVAPAPVAEAPDEPVFYPIGTPVAEEGVAVEEGAVPVSGDAAAAPVAPTAPMPMPMPTAVAGVIPEPVALARPVATPASPAPAERAATAGPAAWSPPAAPATAPVGINVAALDRMLARARVLLNEGRSQEAAAVAANVLAFDPTNEEAQRLRAAAGR